jgi:hypothetical protein
MLDNVPSPVAIAEYEPVHSNYGGKVVSYENPFETVTGVGDDKLTTEPSHYQNLSSKTVMQEDQQKMYEPLCLELRDLGTQAETHTYEPLNIVNQPTNYQDLHAYHNKAAKRQVQESVT